MHQNKSYFFISLLVSVVFFILTVSACQYGSPDSSIDIQNVIESTHIPEITLQTQDPHTDQTKMPVDVAILKKWWASRTILHSDLEILATLNDINFSENKDESYLWIEPHSTNLKNSSIIYQKLFVICAPFSELDSNISRKDFENILTNKEYIPTQLIWIKNSDFQYLKQLYENLALDRFIFSEKMPRECYQKLCWRINLFEESEPYWNILSIDGNDPLHDDFDVNSYPLVYQLSATVNPNISFSEIAHPIIHFQNFQKERVTSVILTGTTALVRTTALRIEEYGLDFPSKNLRNFLSSADITHISNEVPFYQNCPSAVPLRREMRFCSDPKYIDILKDVGADIIELTGNHLLDWGPEAFQETLEIYKTNNLKVYGGGKDLEEASKPLLISIHDNNFVFIGCNVAGPDNNWATNSRPGTKKCDLEKLKEELIRYKSKGFLPIVTLQHFEVEDFKPIKQLRDDFSELAISGATIVSGSQAHFPQGFDFVNDSFIHYGLGNLFFDQMDNWLRKSTIDVHYFYNGKYINTEIYPIINEDYGQPRFMTVDESDLFLKRMFENSFYFLNDN